MSKSSDDPATGSPKRTPKNVATPRPLREGSFVCLEKEGPYTIFYKAGYKPWKLFGNRPHRGKALTKDFKPRVRDSFKTLKEASSARKSLIRKDLGVTELTQMIEARISQEEAEDAATALKILAEVQGWEETKQPLTRAAQFFKERFRKCRKPKDAKKAIDEFEKFKEITNRRAATLGNLHTRLNRLRKVINGQQVHELTAGLVEPLVLRGVFKTRSSYWGTYNDFFEWCAKPPRYYTPHNPCADIFLETDEMIEDESPVVVIPVPKVRSIVFDALTFRGSRLFLYVLNGIFQSLRPSEMVRCQARLMMFGEHWAYFGETEEENYIDVIGKVRTRRSRPVQMYPTLAKIQKRFVDAGYPLVPTGWSNDWNILRARNGYLGCSCLLPDSIDTTNLIPYTKDAMRHTGTTHKLNGTKDEKVTGLWAGDKPDMIFARYKGKTTDKETREFLQILEDLLAVLPTLEELIAQGVPKMITRSECKAAYCPVNKPNTFSLKREDYDARRAAYLQQHPEAAEEEKGERRRGSFYTRRMEVARHIPAERKEQIRMIWTTSPTELSIKLGLCKRTCDIIFGDDLKLPLPGNSFHTWRAGGMSRPELPLEVQEAFPEGVPLSNNRKYIPLPELLKLVWEAPTGKWQEQTGFGIFAIKYRLRGLPIPRGIHSGEMPEEVKELITMSEADLVEVAKKSRADEDDTAAKIVDVPEKVTLSMLFQRAWEVPKSTIRKEWKIGRRVMQSMLQDLPMPETRYWSLFKTERVIPELVKELMKLNEEELLAWRTKKRRERAYACAKRRSANDSQRTPSKGPENSSGVK
jgi:hypothetical protein